MKSFTWEDHRRRDGTLDVLSALSTQAPPYCPPARVRRAAEFIDEVEELLDLTKPHAAQVVLDAALNIVRS